jgi:hypothetical protein
MRQSIGLSGHPVRCQAFQRIDRICLFGNAPLTMAGANRAEIAAVVETSMTFDRQSSRRAHGHACCVSGSAASAATEPAADAGRLGDRGYPSGDPDRAPSDPFTGFRDEEIQVAVRPQAPQARDADMNAGGLKLQKK